MNKRKSTNSHQDIIYVEHMDMNPPKRKKRKINSQGNKQDDVAPNFRWDHPHVKAAMEYFDDLWAQKDKKFL